MPAAAVLASFPFKMIMAILLLGFSGVVFAWLFVVWQLVQQRPLLPRGVLKVAPWGIGAVLLAFAIRIGMEFPVAAVYRAMSPKALAAVPAHLKPNAKPAPASASTKHLLWIVALVNGASILLIPAALRATSAATLDDLGIPRKPTIKDVARGICTYFFIIPIVYGSFFAAMFIWNVVLKHPRNPHPVETALAHEPWPVLTLALVSAVVMAPVAEELLFRGVLLGWLMRVCNQIPKPRREPPVGEADFGEIARERWEPDALDPFAPAEHTPELKAPPRPSWLLPNILASLIFAGVHFPQWPAPVPIFFLSLALGVLYQRTGSLAAPITLHAMFNGVSTVLMFLVVLSGLSLDQREKLAKPIAAPAPPKPGAAPAKLPAPPARKKLQREAATRAARDDVGTGRV
jgi:membrane protease YdiL (CAAX protease family)